MKTWIAALAAPAAFAMGSAGAVTLPAGQYTSTSQITGLIDPAGLCASFGLFAPGSVMSGVATSAALGHTWTIQWVSSSSIGLSTTSCIFPALPAAASFAGNGPAAAYNGTASCNNSASGQTYSLTLSNDASAMPAASSSATFLFTSGKNHGIRFDATAATVTIGSSTVCFVNMQTVLLRTGT